MLCTVCASLLVLVANPREELLTSYPKYARLYEEYFRQYRADLTIYEHPLLSDGDRTFKVRLFEDGASRRRTECSSRGGTNLRN